MSKNKWDSKTRREFLKKTLETSALLSSSLVINPYKAFAAPVERDWKGEYDFVIVGSGAGGGPLAARLAHRGFHVLLLEAGRDHDDPKLTVPAYHGLSTEDPRWSWDFFVRHSDPDLQDPDLFTFDDRKDTKFVSRKGGIHYPRASALGGCTVHNAMITMMADPQDWKSIQAMTGDDSWSPYSMGRLFHKRVENKRYSGPLGFLKNQPDQGNYYQPEGSWLSTEMADPRMALFDANLRSVVFRDYYSKGKTPQNPNWSWLSGRPEGPVLTPQATRQGERSSPREWLLFTEKETEGRLDIKTGYFATTLLFAEGTSSRVKGVKGLYHPEGKNLYQASDEFNRSLVKEAQGFEFRARHQVVLSGGAFNTPQLLMLSGIGDPEELKRHSIPVRKKLPGVGKNLQDRYEFGVVSSFKNDTDAIKECTFDPENVDPCLNDYNKTVDKSEHLYSTNGVVIGHLRKSESIGPDGAADLFVFATPGDFPGYQPGWARKATKKKDKLTWAILKGQTKNTKGYVKLKSKDPHQTPDINFMNFAEGKKEDMAAMMKGVQLARHLNKPNESLISLSDANAREEVWPPKNRESGEAMTPEELETFVMQEVWGHHASCTCKMGPRPEQGDVVDSQFKVHGVDGLSIVDASVFPKIPGLFIVAPIYTIAEKAADVLTKRFS